MLTDSLRGVYVTLRKVIGGFARKTKRAKLGSEPTPASSPPTSQDKDDLDVLNELVVNAAGHTFEKGKTEPITALIRTLYEALIKEVRLSHR